jgi:hypothetical protein
MAKAPAKKTKAPAMMIVVMKKGNGGKKMRGGCEDEGEEYRKGGMVRKPKKKGCK